MQMILTEKERKMKEVQLEREVNKSYFHGARSVQKLYQENKIRIKRFLFWLPKLHPILLTHRWVSQVNSNLNKMFEPISLCWPF